MDEPALIRFFSELTGAPEGSARCVVIYLDLLQRDYFPSALGPDSGTASAAAIQHAGAPWATAKDEGRSHLVYPVHAPRFGLAR